MPPPAPRNAGGSQGGGALCLAPCLELGKTVTCQMFPVPPGHTEMAFWKDVAG